MAPPSLQSLLIIAALLISSTYAQLSAQLIGTWTTKSGKVLTGPGFYDSNHDRFIEPTHTGISYSFTSDGYYETAYYRAISNPTNPSCPQAILQFQHGTVVENADSSLSFTPFAVDGRQLVSDPCAGSTSTYMRYNQSETMQKWQVYTDPYSKMTRLDLYRFDGSPMNPMYLVSRQPLLNPATTINPIVMPTKTAASLAKRGLREQDVMRVSFDTEGVHENRSMGGHMLGMVNLDTLWWAGVSLIVCGGAVYLVCNENLP